MVPTISGVQPAEAVDISTLSIPNNIQLSDPTFNISQEIDVLIGVSHFWDLLLNGKISLGSNGPILQNTKFGWIISGTFNSLSLKSNCFLSKTTIPEDVQLKRFWELNEITDPYEMSSEDQKCEDLFQSNTSKNNQGQFVVKFPFKLNPELLGNSKNHAIQRFLSLTME